MFLITQWSLIKILKSSKDKGPQVGTKRFCKSYNNLCFYDAYRLFQITDKLDLVFKKDQSFFKFTKKIGFKVTNKSNILKNQIVNFAMGV